MPRIVISTCKTSKPTESEIMVSTRYTLYGVEGSYYAAKARSYLLQKPLPFDEIRVDRQVYEKVLRKIIGFPIVPVVVTPGKEAIQDTAILIEALDRRHPENPLIPTTPKRRFAAYLLELFADEWLKIPALHYRWHYDATFAKQMMGENNDPNASKEKQLRVGEKIASRFSTWPKHLGVDNNTQHAVELSLLEHLSILDAHFAIHEYALGASPSLADCALMGPLYPHLFRDPYSGIIVRDSAPNLCQWIQRMRKARAPGQMAESQADEVPTGIIEFLRAITTDYLPMALKAARTTQTWLLHHRNEELPRYLGEQPFTLGIGKPYEAHGTRSVHTVEQWKIQRVINKYQAAPTTEKQVISAFFQELGLVDFLTINCEVPIEYKKFKFHAGKSN